ncbi:RNA polymerase sigma factor [Planctomycetota bacterium]
MEYDDQTDIGGLHHKFFTTHWSLIEDIQAKADKNQALIGLLLEKYWKPVYCYIRRKGYDNELSKDLTQGFFHEVVLNHKLVQKADQSKGRFRAFLLHAVNQYLINETKKSNMRRRIPQDKLIPLDIIDPSKLPRTIQASGSETAYNYAWISALMDQIIANVRRDCHDCGLEIHWQMFSERVVEPILKNHAAPPLSDICKKHGIQQPQKASNMIATVKRKFRSAMRESVRTTVLNDDQVKDELSEIIYFFPKIAQDFE